MKHVSITEVKRHFSRYLNEVAAGEEIVVTVRGKPEARIMGVPRKGGDLQPGSPALIARWLAENPVPEHSRRTREEIDRAIEEERNAWD